MRQSYSFFSGLSLPRSSAPPVERRDTTSISFPSFFVSRISASLIGNFCLLCLPLGKERATQQQHATTRQYNSTGCVKLSKKNLFDPAKNVPDTYSNVMSVSKIIISLMFAVGPWEIEPIFWKHPVD